MTIEESFAHRWLTPEMGNLPFHLPIHTIMSLKGVTAWGLFGYQIISPLKSKVFAHPGNTHTFLLPCCK